MFSYALKRVTRSLGLFGALFLGVVLASTFFAGINIGADTTAKAALNQQLDQVLVDVSASRYGSPLASADWVTMAERVSLVSGVRDVEVISRIELFREVVGKNYNFSRIVGVFADSKVYNGLSITSGASSLQEDEAYVWIGSQDAGKLKINDTLTFNYAIWINGRTENMSLQLKVAGFVDLGETAYALASGQYWSSDEPIILVPSIRQDGRQIYFYGNLIIVDWEETFANFLDDVHALGPTYSTFTTEILVFLDREALINPWDIGASQVAIERIVSQINNEVAEFGITAYSDLQSALFRAQFLSMAMRASFLLVALPVFFVAWYVGTTVSDVSYNLRRREIGLLSARGFSSGQLFRLFLSESVLIGVFGGLIGVGLSLLLSPYFITIVGSEAGRSSPVLTPEVGFLAVIFSTGITLLSTFKPSRRAAKMPTVDALKEYMYVEETKSHKQRWPWAALLLGSYKIGMFLLGIPNLMQFFMGRPPPTTNIFLTILVGLWMIIDTMLTPVGPLLFFWGFTKIFIRGSLGFQELVTRAAKFLGDLGTLATKNVRRNPARAASIAFLIAMIIGYGFQTVGTLASEEDYTIRQVKASVGADISVSLTSLTNSTKVMQEIANFTGVASTALEHSFFGEASYQSLRLIAVDPQKWPSTSYYENEWFAGKDVNAAFEQMADDNYTIILERAVASNLDLDFGDYITLKIGYATVKLGVVGFFGPEMSGGSQPILRYDEYYSGSSFWSYVPADLYSVLEDEVFMSGKILVKLDSDANGTNVAAQIRNLHSNDISHVYSVEEQLAERESNLLLSSTQNIQRMGVIFAVVAASVATALVALVSLQERRKEVTIMNIRGFSFRQLITMLLAENLAIVVFAAALGVMVGLIIVHGNIVALNAEYSTLVNHRMVFPPDAILVLGVTLVFVFSSSILPLIAITKRYISKLERIVRA